MTNVVTQTFIPGPRLIDGSDLNAAFDQVNAAFALEGSNPAITALTTVGAGTITAAGIVGGVTSRGGTQVAVFTDTTATAAQIISAMGDSLPTGSAFYWTYMNGTSYNATLAAGSGVTLSGNTVVPKLTWAQYLVTKTSGSAVSVVFVQGGQLSPLPASQFTADNGEGTTVGPTGLVGSQLNTVNLTGTNPAARPIGPASDLIAAIPNARVGMSFQTEVRNPSANSCTLSGLTGVQIVGTASIATATSRLFQVDVPSLGSINFTSLISSTI